VLWKDRQQDRFRLWEHVTDSRTLRRYFPPYKPHRETNVCSVCPANPALLRLTTPLSTPVAGAPPYGFTCERCRRGRKPHVWTDGRSATHHRGSRSVPLHPRRHAVHLAYPRQSRFPQRSRSGGISATGGRTCTASSNRHGRSRSQMPHNKRGRRVNAGLRAHNDSYPGKEGTRYMNSKSDDTANLVLGGGLE
jgi:hypothetical protein